MSRFHQAALVGEHDGLHAATQTELGQHVGDVRLDGALAHGATYDDQDGNAATASRHRTAVPVDDDILDRYVGTYDVAGTEAMIVRTAKGLSARLPGQGDEPLVAESDDTFFFTDLEGEVHFEVDPTGRVPGGVLYQDGQVLDAVKTS